jgi:predicted dehydrogenase
MFGAGFWSRFQLAGWRELEGARCVALYNRTVSKAEALAKEFGVPAVYGDPEELLRKEKLDFVDIVTHPDTHCALVKLAAARSLPVICQKPMALSLAEAEAMVEACRRAGVPMFVNENFRWQTPIRAARDALKQGRIGRPFRARIQFNFSYPVFDNQPFLRETERFILTDVGSHLLDVARLFFGEAQSLYCHTARIHPDIKGEDVATVMMRMEEGATVLCEMSYATRGEREKYPQTLMFIEAEQGSLELEPDFWLRVTTKDGTHARRIPPRRYAWADPDFDVAHASIVACQENLLAGLRGSAAAETTGEDNLRTMRLVFSSYESAETGRIIKIQ